MLSCAVLSLLATGTAASLGEGMPGRVLAASLSSSITQSATYGWGSNSFGQLGNATTAGVPDTTPSPVGVAEPAGVGFTHVATGGLHSVAIGSDGNLYSWGANEWGQLGLGAANTSDSDTPQLVPPSEFPSGTTFSEVAAGASFSLAVTTGGDVYSWGSDFFGQLGTGTTSASPTPTKVTRLSGVTQVAAGSDFALALTGGGTVYAWGDNEFGQLGDGTTTNRTTPVPLSGTDFPAGTHISQISAGNSDALAVTSSGSVYGWGDDASGQLGDGTYDDTTTPVVAQAAPNGVWSAVSAGASFTLGLTTTGQVFAWGDNQFGQLGDGDVALSCTVGDPNQPTPACSNTPVRVLVPPAAQITSVVAGYSQGYALTAGGSAWAWGNDEFGQIGDNGVAPSPVLTPVGVQLPMGTNAAAVWSGPAASFAFLETGLDQTISSFPSGLEKHYGVPDFPLSLTATSGLAVTLTSASPGVCSTNGLVVHIIGTGSCSITASQAGSDAYNPAPSLSTAFAVDPSQLTVSAASATTAEGSAFTPTYSISGFVGGDTASSAHVTGSASCTTTATAASPPGRYPITCTAGSLAAPNYVFSNFVAGTLTVTAGELGYALVGSDGAVYSYGAAAFYGSAGGMPLNRPVVGMASTRGGRGYWLVASDGGIFSYGDAPFYGSTGGMDLNKPIVGMASTTDGRGYWLVASDGGIFAFGDAPFYGSTGGMTLNEPIVGMASTPDARGYWLVASDGGIFAFGDASFSGSTGGMVLNEPIVAMAATTDGGGYWLVAADGGVFTFGDAPFDGSAADLHLTSPVVGVRAGPFGSGYWIVSARGGVYGFALPFFGSPLTLDLNAPIAGIG